MTEPSLPLRILEVLGLVKINRKETPNHDQLYTLPKKQKKAKNIIRIPYKIPFVIILPILIAVLPLLTLIPDDSKTEEQQKAEPLYLNNEECRALQGEVESQAADFPDEDYDKWKHSNCIKFCEAEISLNKHYQKKNFIEFLHEGCPDRTIMIIDQECTTDKETDVRQCKTITIGELH